MDKATLKSKNIKELKTIASEFSVNSILQLKKT